MEAEHGAAAALGAHPNLRASPCLPKPPAPAPTALVEHFPPPSTSQRGPCTANIACTCCLENSWVLLTPTAR